MRNLSVMFVTAVCFLFLLKFPKMTEKQEFLERRGLRKMGGENSPISPPLDPRLAELVFCFRLRRFDFLQIVSLYASDKEVGVVIRLRLRLRASSLVKNSLSSERMNDSLR